MLNGKRMEPVFPGEIVICYNDWLLLQRKRSGKHWSVSVWCVLPWVSSWASALRQFTVQGNMFVKVWMCCAMFMHKLHLACLAGVLCPLGNEHILSAQMMTKWFYSTRLETRTKESSICASSWVANLCAQWKWLLGYLRQQPTNQLREVWVWAFLLGPERWWTMPEKGKLRGNSDGGS